jgi:hypothetical protein
MIEKEKIEYKYFNTEKITNLNENISSSFRNENKEEYLSNNNSILNIKKNNQFFKNNSIKNFSKISSQSKSSLFNINSIIKKRFSTPKRIIPDRLIIKIGKNDYEPKRKSIFDISKPFKKNKNISYLELYEKEKENKKFKKLFMNIFDDNNEHIKKIEKNLLLIKNNIIKIDKKEEYKKSIFYLNTTNNSNFNKKIKIDFRPLKIIKIPTKLMIYNNFNNSKFNKSLSTNNSSMNNSLTKKEIHFNKSRNLKLKYLIPNLRYEMIINNLKIKNKNMLTKIN